MKTAGVAKRKVTLTLEADVYEAIQKRVGARKVGSYLSRLARSYVTTPALSESYRALAADTVQAVEVADLATHDDPIAAPNVWPR